MADTPLDPHAVTGPAAPPAGRRGLRVAAWLIVAGLLVAAASTDVPAMFQGVKGDEATYVSMALSAAYDGDLKFTSRDLERFYTFYHSGPEGIFLKQSKRVTVDWRAGLPRLRVVPRGPGEALDYGKAFVYPLLAAPFVRVFGLSGFLVLNVGLLALVTWCAVRFAQARQQGLAGVLFGIAFVAVSITPVYAVWLTSEVFNFALVFLGLFLWLYKDGPAATGPRWLLGPPSDWLAAICLGIATFSKPPNALLIVPVVLVLLWRRRWTPAVIVSLCFLAASAGGFALNGLISGDLNYQGGGQGRRTFYGRYPFSDRETTFESLGTAMATDDSNTDQMVGVHHFWSMLGYNSAYFVAGRHAGLIPYSFPGVVALVLWAWRWRRADVRTLLVLAVVASVVVLLVLAPNSWNGGGGPPGNRYFLSLYAALFFVAPPVIGMAAAIAAWAGGLVFLAPLLLTPFATAARPWTAVDTPPLRLLPVELTLVDDLPVRLNPVRGRILYSHDPDILLYFLDGRSWPPEGHGLWVQGGATTEVVVRADRPLGRLRIVWHSPVNNRVHASMGGSTVTLDVPGGSEAVTWMQLGAGVPDLHGAYSYLLRMSTTAGFVPALAEPGSTDNRYLGAFADLTFTPRSAP